ncbi:MAG: class I SAM-dependent methyltransferase [Methanotrichaceae archaeon]|nr:class I SAM-dependent methyltransferase [Methanotrichaceae archaeon]
MSTIDVFEKHAAEYDEWFDQNEGVYKSEIQALKDLIPQEGVGLEVGVGTGRFALPLGIRAGVEPAKSMAKMARKRGIKVHEASADALPFGDESFDFVLIMTVLCFLEDPLAALLEARRVLKPGGLIIIGMIDSDSPLGQEYERKKLTSKFYRNARFRSAEQVLSWLKGLDFNCTEARQTVFGRRNEIDSIEPFEAGHGKGAFVAIAARKRAGENWGGLSASTQ